MVQIFKTIDPAQSSFLNEVSIIYPELKKSLGHKKHWLYLCQIFWEYHVNLCRLRICDEILNFQICLLVKI